MEEIKTQIFNFTNRKKDHNYKPKHATIFPQINDILLSWQLTIWLSKNRKNIFFRKKCKVDVNLGSLNVEG